MLFGRKECEPEASDNKASLGKETFGRTAGTAAGEAAPSFTYSDVAAQIEELTRSYEQRFDELNRFLGDRLRGQDQAIRRLEDALQLALLEDGRELVAVPAHMEIRKVTKHK
jgi:hypothetical protein